MRLILFLLLFSESLMAQVPNYHQMRVENALKAFRQSHDDSICIILYSVAPFRRDTLNLHPGNSDAGDSLYQALSQLHPGEVLGPIADSSGTWLVKAERVDSALMVCAGFILIGQQEADKNRQREAAARKLLTADTTSAGSCCRADTRREEQPDKISYQWIGTDALEKPVTDEILRHRSGDVFTAQSRYGTYVIKLISGPQRRPVRLIYLPLKVD